MPFWKNDIKMRQGSSWKTWVDPLGKEKKKYNQGFKKIFMGGIFIENPQILFHGVKGRYKNKIGSSKLENNIKNTLLVFPFYVAFIK